MAEVFISYARANEPTARRVAEGLQACGYDVWSDAQLPAHRSYAEIIQDRLRSAKAVVVLWSEEAVRSQWVRSEADFARREGKLVQAQLDDAAPPLPFDQVQYARLKGWRGRQRHPGWLTLKESVAELAKGDDSASEAPPPVLKASLLWQRWWLVAIALAVVVGALVLAQRLTGPAAQAGPPEVAVLPFRNLSAEGDNLVAGIWEDTRQALARNPSLKVLGRQSAQVLAERELEPEQYRSKLGIDYLLEGSVRQSGQRIRVSVNLIRTADATEVWAETFDYLLDDVFELQTKIAREIEGRIRGRLAARGGTRAENITTSGPVYALYSEARANLRRRDHESIEKAHAQLEAAANMDPNFAPAWAALSIATRLHVGFDESPKHARHAAIAHARRALSLAPNLSQAHAALAYAHDFRGPVASTALARAVDLDPTNAEALLWLGNSLADQNRLQDALNAYSRALDIDPLFTSAIQNKVSLQLSFGDLKGAQREVTRLEQLGGDGVMAAVAKMHIAEAKGDLSARARIGLEQLRRTGGADRRQLIIPLGQTLLQLGYYDETARLAGLPDVMPRIFKGQLPTEDEFAEFAPDAASFWQRENSFPLVLARNLLNHGRSAQLARFYHDAFSSPGEMADAIPEQDNFINLAPLVAAALEQTGDARAAAALLSAAEEILAERRAHGPLRSDDQVLYARLRAGQRRTREALHLLSGAVERGWLPDARSLPTDLAQDPAFAPIRNAPAFQAIRSRILNHIDGERRELGVVRL